MTEQSISESLWWIIPGKLGGMRKPTPEEIPTLRELGVDTVVSVMDDPSNLDRYGQENVPSLWLPTLGGTAPTHDQIDQFQQFVEMQNALSRSVVVHCSSGRRRTGTFLAAYLVRTGYSAQGSIETLRNVNPDVELREAQIAFLQSLEMS